jgi:glycolate oxidase iron-sulfur subunit
MARRLHERKLGHVEATGATVVVTANPRCILQLAQLAAGLGAPGRGVEVRHVVEGLDRAYLAAEGARR